MNEGRALANIESPHVVKCFGVEELDQEYFLVIEYVAGDTLDQWRDKSHPSTREIIEKFRQLILAIEAVHDQGLFTSIFHRRMRSSITMVNSN